MSCTKVDMPKVCQMFDAGWEIRMYKNRIGTYTIEATHQEDRIVLFAINRLKQAIVDANPNLSYDTIEMLAGLNTDDFTPEQALTRMAYKVHGEII